MAAHHVFLVHGIGDHAKGWSASWQTTITDNARLFAPYADGTRELADDITFVEVTYDDVFEKDYRQRWKDLGSALADSQLPSALRPVFTELAQSEGSRLPEFFWTHALDVLLWFGLGQAREAVISKVGRQLGEGLKAAIAEDAQVHILAHSLGTSVIHDTLLCLAAAPKTQKAFDPKKGGVRWDTLVTVANVSRLVGAWESPSDDLPVDAFRPHLSRVRGGDLVDTFINVQHLLDPFTFPRRFKPDWNTPPYWPVQPDRFDEPLHVHDLETQFDHPGVARRCLREFTGRATLGTNAEMEAAWRRYEQKYGRSGGDLFARLRGLLVPDDERKLGLGELARYLVAYAKEVLP